MTDKKPKKKRIYKDRSNILSLTERHIISEHHPFFQECDALCFLSKNLYNATLALHEGLLSYRHNPKVKTIKV